MSSYLVHCHFMSEDELHAHAWKPVHFPQNVDVDFLGLDASRCVVIRAFEIVDGENLGIDGAKVGDDEFVRIGRVVAVVADEVEVLNDEASFINV